MSTFYGFYDSSTSFYTQLWFKTQMKPQITCLSAELYSDLLFIYTIRWWWWFLWVFPYVKLNLNLFTAVFSRPRLILFFFHTLDAKFFQYCLQGKRKSADLSKGWAVSGNENTSLETQTHFFFLLRCLSELSQTCRAALWISSSASWGKKNTLY